jgi:hypothetical protein
MVELFRLPMSSKPITMRKIKEVLRLRFECGLSLNAIARALELSKGAVAKYDALARAAQLDWQAVCCRPKQSGQAKVHLLRLTLSRSTKR